MGGGNDVFIWNPGDGNDTIEGGTGNDTLRFKGENVQRDILHPRRSRRTCRV